MSCAFVVSCCGRAEADCVGVMIGRGLLRWRLQLGRGKRITLGLGYGENRLT
jgi:hypothetical protein